MTSPAALAEMLMASLQTYNVAVLGPDEQRALAMTLIALGSSVNYSMAEWERRVMHAVLDVSVGARMVSTAGRNSGSEPEPRAP